MPRGLAVTSAIILRLFIVGAGIYFVARFFNGLLTLLLPVIVALFLTTILFPASSSLQRRGLPAALAAGLLVLAAVLVFFGLLGLIIPPFVLQLGDVGASVRLGTETVAGVLEPLGISREQVTTAVDGAIDSLSGSTGQVAGEVVSGALVVTNVVISILLTLVLTFFFVKDGASLWQWIVELFARYRRDDVREIGNRSWSALSSYVRGILVVATVDAVLIGAALLVLGVPLALPLIVLTFLAAFFPIVGAVAAGIAAILVALVAKGLVSALIMVVVIFVVQQVEGNVLYPLVVGRQLNLHPVAILVALTAGGLVGGVPGAFLAVPLAAITAAIMDYARVHDPDVAPLAADAAREVEAAPEPVPEPVGSRVA